MKLTDKNLQELVSTFMLSSGPDVYIFYNTEEDNFYATLHCFPKNTRHPNIMKIKVFDFLGGRNYTLKLSNHISNAINDFISDCRNKKIDDILS